MNLSRNVKARVKSNYNEIKNPIAIKARFTI